MAGPASAHPSFSFAQYQGKSEGAPATWTAFWGTYTLTMNQDMLRLILDSIDDGSGDDGLDDEMFELANALEDLLPDSDPPRGQGETKAVTTRMFSCTTFNNTFTIQCRVEGLEQLHEAVCAGADYNGDGGSSLFALTGQMAGLIQRERERKREKEAEKEPVPQGYLPQPRRRRRKGEEA